MIGKLVSGGQSGVDRAALDVALELGDQPTAAAARESPSAGARRRPSPERPRTRGGVSLRLSEQAARRQRFRQPAFTRSSSRARRTSSRDHDLSFHDQPASTVEVLLQRLNQFLGDHAGQAGSGINAAAR